MKKLDIIQVLRGLAACLVIMLHIKIMFNGNERHWGDILFGSGGIGVDLFFIISGFIMVYTTLHRSGPRDSARFMINRIARVLPLYLIMTVIFRTFIRNDIYWWAEKSNVLGFIKAMLFIPMDLHAAQPFFGYAPLLVGWTLQYEMFFYLIFGIALLFGRYRWWFIGIFFTLLLIVIPIVFGHFRINAWEMVSYPISYLNFATNPLLLEFVMGMGIAWVYLSKFELPKPVAYIFVVIACGIFLWQYFMKTSLQPGHGPCEWGFGSALVVLSLLLLVKTVDLKIPHFLVFMGNISYSLYLVHMLVNFTLMFSFRFFHLPEFEMHAYYFPLYFGILVGAAYLSYRFIEQRLSNWIKMQALKILHLA